jgi:ElaB/YqjD/DUF883 family membrane-anchored ribosome-binding protein
MSYAQRLGEELDSLKDELSRLASENASAAVSASREKIDAAAKMLGDAMGDIEEFVGREEENIEKFISGRPLVSVAAAFLAGIAVGVILRRR